MQGNVLFRLDPLTDPGLLRVLSVSFGFDEKQGGGDEQQGR
jgi:hypothetical protein